MQAAVDTVNNVESSRGGTYTRIGGLSIVYSEANNALSVRLVGACALIFRLFVVQAGVYLSDAAQLNQTLTQRDLILASTPSCHLYENGAPLPPPSPPSPPPPSSPPAAPPATVPILAKLSMSMNQAISTFTPSQVQTISVIIFRWVLLQSQVAGSRSAVVTLREGIELSVFASSLFDSSASNLLARLESVTRGALCSNSKACSVSATTNEFSPVQRRLQAASSEYMQSNDTVPAAPPTAPYTLPAPPGLPAQPLLPQTSPPIQPDISPSPPKTYADLVTVSIDRERNAADAWYEQKVGSSISSQWIASMNESSLARSHTIEQRGVRMTSLTADIDLVVSAENYTFAYEIAGNTFAILLNRSFLLQLLSEANLDSNSLVVDSLRAEFWHPIDGLVVIEGSLPPPPPLTLDSPDAALRQTVESTTTVVTIVVASAVVASVAASIVASLTASVAASTASATGGATASSGAAGGGAGALPLIFGAQRFSSSQGIAVEKSPIHTGVADGMKWIKGDFGETSDSEGRRLLRSIAGRNLAAKKNSGGREVTGVQGEALNAVTSTLNTFGYVEGAIALLMIFVHIWWRFRRNKRFYAERGLTEIQRRSLYKTKARVPRAAKFASLPGAFVFPSVLMLGINFFINGLIQPAMTLASVPSTEDTCGTQCGAIAGAILALIALYLIISLSLLVHFHLTHRKHVWTEAEEPAEPNDVEDVLYRFISKIRARLLQNPKHPFVVMDRVRGVFVRPEDDEAEPERTERLLARPLVLFRGRAADAMDALRLTWFQRANGRSLIGISYDLVAVSAGAFIAALNGLGPNLEPDSTDALFQSVTVMAIQICACLYVFILKPSADRIDNTLTGTQFLLEGGQTASLLYATALRRSNGFESSTHFQTLGFLLGISALFVPIVEKVYDALVTQISACCRREFDPLGAFYASLSLALALPGLFMQQLGVANGTVDAVTGSIDEAASSMELAAEERFVHEIENAAADAAAIASQIAGELFWMQNSLKHNKAATRLQANWRGLRQRNTWDPHADERATEVILKWQTKIAAVRQSMTLERAAIVVQKAYRGARERQKLEAEGDGRKAQLVWNARANRVTSLRKEAAETSKRIVLRSRVLREKAELRRAKRATQATQDDRLQRESKLESRHGAKRPGFEWLEKHLATSQPKETGESAIELEPELVSATRSSTRAIRAPPTNYPPGFKSEMAILALPAQYPPFIKQQHRARSRIPMHGTIPGAQPPVQSKQVLSFGITEEAQQQREVEAKPRRVWDSPCDDYLAARERVAAKAQRARQLYV